MFFNLPDQSQQSGLVVGIARMDLIVKNDPGTVLHQLQGAAELHRPVELALADRSGLGDRKRKQSARRSSAFLEASHRSDSKLSRPAPCAQ